MVGMGSSVFHPESSRVARLASGGRHGFAQSLFQVGGNVGSAIGPLIAAFIILPARPDQPRLVLGAGAWSPWQRAVRRRQLVSSRTARPAPRSARRASMCAPQLSKTRRSTLALLVLLALMFSKFFYTASLSSYYTFYLIDRFGVSVQTSQIFLFVFLGAFAAGTLAGGPIGDWIGRKRGDLVLDPGRRCPSPCCCPTPICSGPWC